MIYALIIFVAGLIGAFIMNAAEPPVWSDTPIDPAEFNFVSQVSHAIGGCLIIVGLVLLCGMPILPYAIVLDVIGPFMKEFWSDEKNETPSVRGSSLEDYLFYELGGGIGVGIVYLNFYFGDALKHWVQLHL